MTFDIRDSRHQYRPCPRCGATVGMGLVLRSVNPAGDTGIAVQCAQCGFRGTEYPVTDASPMANDELALIAWNDLRRN